MSIVRIGLAEKKQFAEGYDAIFGKKPAPPPAAEPKTAEPAAATKTDGPAAEGKPVEGK